MANYLSDYNGVVFSGILAKAQESAAIRTIETQMLDGSYTIQTVGSNSKKVSVEFYSSTAVRRTLETFAFSGQAIKVYLRDRIWTGFISGGEIKWESWSKNHAKVQEKLVFEILVTGEASR